MVLSFGRKNLLKEIILPLSYKIKYTSHLIIKNALLIFINKKKMVLRFGRKKSFKGN